MCPIPTSFSWNFAMLRTKVKNEKQQQRGFHMLHKLPKCGSKGMFHDCMGALTKG